MKKQLAMQQLINESNLAISEICEMLNVSRFIVHKWRSGDSNPRRENLNKLAQINNVKLIWKNNDNVSIEQVNQVNYKEEHAKESLPLDLIINNQVDLIDILKKENSKLKNNINKFRRSKKITTEFDYSIVRTIHPEEIVKINVPDQGLLGYTQKEFIKLSKLWPSSPLYSRKDQESLKKFEKVRIDLAETLGISHFDISDHILYKMKDRNKKWGYFTKYYDIEMNSINVYVKFLDFAN